MSSNLLENRIDFVVVFSVEGANPNGDPANDNRPRTDFNEYGYVTDVCIKRKIRNRMQKMGYDIFVKSNDKADDGFKSLKERAASAGIMSMKTEDEVNKFSCEKWIDVRSFGQVFAFSGLQSKTAAVRGCVDIGFAKSISPIEISTFQITKSVNGESSNEKSSDTMGERDLVNFGLYRFFGSINVPMSNKNGFTRDDAEVIKEAIRTLFVDDVSVSRHSDSCNIEKFYWFEHDCEIGVCNQRRIKNLVKINLKDNDKIFPTSIDDYEITVDTIDGVKMEEIKCL